MPLRAPLGKKGGGAEYPNEAARARNAGDERGIASDEVGDSDGDSGGIGGDKSYF